MNFETDLFQELKLKKRQPINIIHNLSGRELGTNSCTLYTVNLFNDFSNKNEQTKFNLMKRVYLSITPNYSILNVKIPNCYLRRFSPDGRYLIAFNQNLNGVQVFRFNGSSAGIESINKIHSANSSHQANQNTNQFQDKTDFNQPESNQFRSRAFDTYFKETANIKLTKNNELIHRECALFYKSSYLIVASSVMVSDENLPPYDQLAANNEAMHHNIVENYTIYLVDIKRNILCDQIKFSADKINLTHNQSLSLFKNVFTVLSQQNQTIYLYNIIKSSPNYDSNSGLNQNQIKYKFVQVNQIGRFCFSDDLDYFQNPLLLTNMEYNNKLRSKTSTSNSITKYNRRQSRFANIPSSKGFTETSFTSMKQRIISFFYKEAIENNTLDQFYLNLNNIQKLRMYKMQLLDERFMLIKYVNLDHMVCQKSSITISNRSVNQTTTTTTTVTSTNPTTSTSASTIAIQASTQPSIPNLLIGGIPNSTVFASTSTSDNTQTSVTNIPVILNENTVPFYFVLYDIKLAKILNILKDNSCELLNIYENLQDYFSMATLDGFSAENENEPYGSSFNFHTLASNNLYANELLNRHIKNILKINSTTEMAKCLLSQLSISSQSYTTTPYLDHSLFSYDEKLISNLERPKPIGDQIIKFNMRETGRLCFRLYPGLQIAADNPHHLFLKRLVAFIWHPREPFCISVQRATQEYNVNFHVYSKNNIG